MEPLSTAAIAIAAAIATKTIEMTSENFGEKVVNFLTNLRKKSPQTATAIEQAPEQPLDYGEAVLEVEAVAKANPEVKEAMEELAIAAKAETNPQLSAIFNAPNLQKLAEKIGQAVMPGGTGNIDKMSF